MKLRSIGGCSAALAVVVAFAAGGVLAFPGGSQAQGSPYSFVAGSGKVTFPNFPEQGVSTTAQFMISGHDGPGGPSGTIIVRSPVYSIEPAIADVMCVVVNGNDAIVGGKFRQPFTFIGLVTISHIGIIVRDNGSPGQGGPDEIHPVEFIDKVRPPTFSPCISQPVLFPLDEATWSSPRAAARRNSRAT